MRQPIKALLYTPSPDYTPASPDYSPASDSESDPSEDPSSDIYTHYTISHFIIGCMTPQTDDTPDTTPSPTYEPVHMMTVRKRVRPLPTHRLAVRHYADHSSSDSSLKASSDFHSDASSDSSSRHSLSDHSSPDLPSTSDELSPLSPVRADLIPSPKRVKDSGYLADVEVDPREISLRMMSLSGEALRDSEIDG
ncbi:hypothetical protein Tco_0401271 [Tanacetum coccineum]